MIFNRCCPEEFPITTSLGFDPIRGAMRSERGDSYASRWPGGRTFPEYGEDRIVLIRLPNTMRCKILAVWLVAMGWLGAGDAPGQPALADKAPKQVMPADGETLTTFLTAVLRWEYPARSAAA